MNALVAQVAIAVFPNQVPIIMQMLAAERLNRRGAAPEIVVNRLGNRLFALHLADARPGFVAQAAGHVDLSKLPGMKKIHRLADTGRATNLRPRLADFVVLASRLDNLSSF